MAVRFGAYRKGGISYEALLEGARRFGHIDTAMVYGNVTKSINDVCRAILDESGSLVKITTKVNDSAWSDPDSIFKHVADLEYGGGVVVEILMHSPVIAIKDESMRASAYEKDLECFRKLREWFPSKKVGLSNFDCQRVQWLLSKGEKPDSVHMEWSAWVQPRGLKALCEKNGIEVVGFRPFYNGDHRLPEGVSHNMVIRWMLEKGMCVVLSSNSVDHIRDNSDYKNVELSEDVISVLDDMCPDWSTSCMVKFCHDYKPVW